METKDIINSIGVVIGIVLGLYGAANSWRANKRLDENDGMVFRVFPGSADNNTEWLEVDLLIRNERSNSIFISKITPLNFEHLVPAIRIEYESGFAKTVYSEPQNKYDCSLREILRNDEQRFEFKIPKHVRNLKLKVDYQYGTTKGLKEATRVYEHMI